MDRRPGRELRCGPFPELNGRAQVVKPPWARPSATPTNAATRPVTMSIRCSLVAETSWLYKPTTRDARPRTVARHGWAHDPSGGKGAKPGDKGEHGERVLQRMAPAVTVERDMREAQIWTGRSEERR